MTFCDKQSFMKPKQNSSESVRLKVYFKVCFQVLKVTWKSNKKHGKQLFKRACFKI